ncbi:MAG TPA: outer membrane protein transport protein [Oligoflexus sp.]|uniref:OmpP1/FadL family transporter n=1 Tax=Oligoflexus sp. TaxID=1971216 RepID=UPI002D809CD3|nr:outer membrane protein transport protein [Oligoflexus sp.]HET9240107.1 outer membrane protein transport protein [Oligoflexus sp.]
MRKVSVIGLTLMAKMQTVQAAGFAVKQQSASSMGTAFAADGVGQDDISTLFTNPALLEKVEGSEVAASLVFMSPVLEFKNGSSSTAAGTPYANQSSLKTEQSDIMESKIMPTFYAATRLNQDWHVGLSMNAAWGSASKYASDWVGRYYATETELTGINLGLLTSYQVLPGLTLGGGVQLQRANGLLAQAVDLGSVIYRAQRLAGAAGDPTLVGNRDIIAEFKGQGDSAGFVLGLTYDITSALELGLSYRSPVKHKVEGDMTFAAENVASQLTLTQVASREAQFRSADASLSMSTPAIYVAGLSYRALSQLTVYGNATYTDWDSMEKLEIKYGEGQSTKTLLGWKDSVYAAVGADYAFVAGQKLRAGFAYESEPIEDGLRNPRSPGSDRTVYALGYGYQSMSGYYFDAGFNYYQYKSAPLDLKASAYAENQIRGNLSGEYERNIKLLMLQTGRKF